MRDPLNGRERERESSWSDAGAVDALTVAQLTLKTCAVRSWRTSDAESLLRYANNHKIWLNLRDAFPHPYTQAGRARLHPIGARARARNHLRDRGRRTRRSAASASCCGTTSSACRRRSATGSPSRSGDAASRPRRSSRRHQVRDRDARPDARLRAAVRLEHRRRAACWRRRATCSKRGCGAARSRTARSPIRCSTRSSRRCRPQPDSRSLCSS